MLSRRKFLKVFGLASLAFSLLPSIGLRTSSVSWFGHSGTVPVVKNWLYGSPRRGCSTPDLSFGDQWKHAKGLSDLVAIQIPADFVSQIPHEQYLS